MLYCQEEGGRGDGQELPAAAASLEETSFSSIDSSLNDEIQVCALGNTDVMRCAVLSARGHKVRRCKARKARPCMA